MNTPFIASLSHVGFGCILNGKATETAGENYGQNPVGTGPYKFDSWAKGDKIVLERFEDFNGTKPAAKTMILMTITEATTRAIELETGAVDIALDITPNDLERVKGNKDLKLLRKTGNLTTYVGMNTAKKPFDDPGVRQAISLAMGPEGAHVSRCPLLFRQTRGPAVRHGKGKKTAQGSRVRQRLQGPGLDQ